MRNEELSQDTNPHHTLQPMPRLVRVHCQRTGTDISREEHQHCPYCFGKVDDIANGQHERVCDFRHARDPIHNCFPPDTLREREG